jgi:hypothetical protein
MRSLKESLLMKPMAGSGFSKQKAKTGQKGVWTMKDFRDLPDD